MQVSDSNCTPLGEDKLQDMKAAIQVAGKRRCKALSRMHYGEVPFLLGYAAAGDELQCSLLLGFRWHICSQAVSKKL